MEYIMLGVVTWVAVAGLVTLIIIDIVRVSKELKERKEYEEYVSIFGRDMVDSIYVYHVISCDCVHGAASKERKKSKKRRKGSGKGK